MISSRSSRETLSAVMIKLGQDYLPSRPGTASGVTLGLGVSIGGLVAPVFGAIAEARGTAAVFTVMCFVPVLALILGALLPDPAAAEGNWVAHRVRKRGLAQVARGPAGSGGPGYRKQDQPGTPEIQVTARTPEAAPGASTAAERTRVTPRGAVQMCMVASMSTLGRACCGNHAQAMISLGACGAEVASGTPVPPLPPSGWAACASGYRRRY